jgi:hypothetical protein
LSGNSPSQRLERDKHAELLRRDKHAKLVEVAEVTDVFGRGRARWSEGCRRGWSSRCRGAGGQTVRGEREEEGEWTNKRYPGR